MSRGGSARALRRKAAWSALLLAAAGVAGVAGMSRTAGAAGAPPPLPAEHLEVAKLPPWSPHWAYLYDDSFANETDVRLYLYDGDAHRMLGQYDAGYYPAISISPDHKTAAIATTYWSRGAHGTRTDVIEYGDNTTLSVRGELMLPPKRAQTAAVSNYGVSYSSDQRFLYVANLSPAASFSIIDIAKNAIVGDVDTDGCVQVIPSGKRRVSALCENGRLLTVTHDDTGAETARSVSQPFFSADRDPIFVQSAPTPTGVVHVSFLGDVYAIDLSGAEPRFAPPWPTVTLKERGHWRPGGQQVVAYHARSGRLYLPMHRGGEGSHKDGATEIWVFDASTHKRLARWPVNAAKYGGVIAVLATQDERPLLFAATEKSALFVIDAMSGRLQHVEARLGQTLWSMMNP
jgi:methylamine dehydrogenase heavy chain